MNIERPNNARHWAAIPLHSIAAREIVLGSGAKIRPANKHDIDEGKKYLFGFLSLLPDLKFIVLSGGKAQKAATLITAKYPKISIVRMPHPSPLFVNQCPRKQIQNTANTTSSFSQCLVAPVGSCPALGEIKYCCVT